jgi:GntR family transcriptional regulator, transcriptional repressor for pyruvate dehydrogenase complex
MTGQSWPKPVARTLADQVVEMLLTQIASGRLRPGTSLPAQRELAKQLGVGLAVLREALQRLQSLRVLKAYHGRGTIVEGIKWNQLIFEPALSLMALERQMLNQLWEARYAIEKETVRLAAVRADDDDLAAMRKVLDEAVPDPVDYAENRRLNRAFHLALARASKNDVLVDLLAPLLEIEPSAMRTVFDAEISSETWEVHRAIHAAVEAGDVAAASAAMEQHVAASDTKMRKLQELTARTAGAGRRRSKVAAG